MSEYVSIDIETTGLNPDTCQVLEIAMVYDDRSKRVKECPFWHSILKQDWIVGEPNALTMNQKLLEIIANGGGDSVRIAMESALRWCQSRVAKGLLHPLGKNVASFDWQFLKRLPGFPVKFFSHRMCDIGSLYATADGMKSQSELSGQLAEEFEIPGKPHEALYDARMSLALARVKWGIEI